MSKRPWIVVSSSLFGEYRRRSFRTKRGAQAFVVLRTLFYLMPAAFPSWVRIEREYPQLGLAARNGEQA